MLIDNNIHYAQMSGIVQNMLYNIENSLFLGIVRKMGTFYLCNRNRNKN